MTYGIYVIREAKTTFMLPTVDFNNASAMRNFEHAVRHPDSLMKSHPNDFGLYRVGSFDNETGEIMPEFPPQFICDATVCLRKEDE